MFYSNILTNISSGFHAKYKIHIVQKKLEN